jgi:hypothetical protein
MREPVREIGETRVLVRVGQDITAQVTLVVKAAGGVLEGGDDDDSSPADQAGE